MTVKPSDFATREEALEYVNTRLDEWGERFLELEKSIAYLLESPPSEEVERTATSYQERDVVIQGVKA